jgi:hypothetical protein
MATTSSGATSFLSSAPPAKPPRIWIRLGAAKDNILVVSDREIAAGTVARNKLDRARDELETCRQLEEVLGANAVYIPLVSVRSISARMNCKELTIDYALGSRKFATRHIPVADRETQAEILEECHRQLGPAAVVARTVGSRLFHSFKIFNLFMVLAMVACGFDYVAVNAFGVRESKGHVSRVSREEWSHQATRDRANARMLNRVLRGAPKSPYVAIAIAAAVALTGVLLATLGYELTLAIIGGAATVTLCWAGARCAKPPVTISVVVTGRT